MSEIQTPTPEPVRAARIAADLTQSACAERFGYSLRRWQAKEDAGQYGSTLSLGEYELLLLLAGQHPDYTLTLR